MSSPLVTMATFITGPSVLLEVRALGEATVSGVLYEAKRHLWRLSVRL